MDAFAVGLSLSSDVLRAHRSMWEDDEYWYPHMLNGEPFDGICHFESAPSSSPSTKPTWAMRSHEIRVVDALEDEPLLP